MKKLMLWMAACLWLGLPAGGWEDCRHLIRKDLLATRQACEKALSIVRTLRLGREEDSGLASFQAQLLQTLAEQKQQSTGLEVVIASVRGHTRARN